MRHRVVHLINPKTDSLTTRPLYLNRALYSPLAGLLAVAGVIPRNRYEVVLTDENVESIDFNVKADLVGISAMTSYVNRGYEIADAFRTRGVPVVMGGIHPSFMPQEALQHCDAVVIGEAELVIEKLLNDLEQGAMRGAYRADRLHPMDGLPMPRYDLIKKNRYVNRTFVQTSRGCRQGCTFCAEPLMNGLKVRYRPVEEVIREVENCGARTISINDADFFNTPERPKEIMRALKGRGISWQAGVTSKLAQDDRMLELAAASGCTMLSIGFESISRNTLKSVHKDVNRPETFAALVEKVHSYGIMVFGLFMFGFDSDDTSVFQQTARFNIEADFDVCAYSVLTPYPGTLTWYEMKKAERIVSFDWDKYDQANVVYLPAQMSGDELRRGQIAAYETFYAPSSLARRFPLCGKRSWLQWSVYNLFMKKGAATDRKDAVAVATEAPDVVPVPPIFPLQRELRQAVLDATGDVGESPPDGTRIDEYRAKAARTRARHAYHRAQCKPRHR
ncbi:MAG: B12-binding domain-containing radical SAM protein [Thermoguttaceae bacterium]